MLLIPTDTWALALVYMVFVIVFKDRNNYTKWKCRFNIYWREEGK
jgi:hypothetical protein